MVMKSNLLAHSLSFCASLPPSLPLHCSLLPLYFGCDLIPFSPVIPTPFLSSDANDCQKHSFRGHVCFRSLVFYTSLSFAYKSRGRSCEAETRVVTPTDMIYLHGSYSPGIGILNLFLSGSLSYSLFFCLSSQPVSPPLSFFISLFFLPSCSLSISFGLGD